MTSIDALAGQSAQVQQSSNQLNQDFDDFLTLLTTQLQNQDPLDPQDTNEFTNQLVQFSQVEQQIRSNDILDDLRALDVLQITQIGLGFVGLEVELTGDQFNYDGQSDVDLGYNLPSASTGTTVSIRNEAGNVVHTFSGETSPGIKSYKWDGMTDEGLQAPPGQYSITVSGLDVEGNSLNIATRVPGLVEGIESDGNGNTLLIIGDLKLPITDVTRAKLPASSIPGAEDTTDDTSGDTSDTGT